MTDSLHPSPLIVDLQGHGTPLDRVPLKGSGATTGYDEHWLQELLFRHPEALPVAELDSSFLGLVPVCRELNVAGVYIDVLYATPRGKLVVLEVKLWRNPEARREVIGQVLDYAEKLTRWSYETLDAAVRAARASEVRAGRPAGLWDTVRAVAPAADETLFHDSIAQSLERGDFLLIIAGDGIRQGAGAIAAFLERYGSLNFTFGLVEMAVYRMPAGGLLVQPRVIAQSEIVRRIVVQVEGRATVLADEAEAEDAEAGTSAALDETRRTYEAFWTEFLARLRPRLDDKSQPLPAPSRSTNQYFHVAGDKAWISAYLAQSSGRCGVYLRFLRGPFGDRVYRALEADRAAIDRELGEGIEWESEGGKHSIVHRRTFSGTLLTDRREEVQEWLVPVVNRFITVLRPRIEALAQGDGA